MIIKNKQYISFRYNRIWTIRFSEELWVDKKILTYGSIFKGEYSGYTYNFQNQSFCNNDLEVNMQLNGNTLVVQ